MNDQKNNAHAREEQKTAPKTADIKHGDAKPTHKPADAHSNSK